MKIALMFIFEILCRRSFDGYRSKIIVSCMQHILSDDGLQTHKSLMTEDTFSNARRPGKLPSLSDLQSFVQLHERRLLVFYKRR